eukprot:1032691-Rhodomonas_salina.2
MATTHDWGTSVHVSAPYIAALSAQTESDLRRRFAQEENDARSHHRGGKELDAEQQTTFQSQISCSEPHDRNRSWHLRQHRTSHTECEARERDATCQPQTLESDVNDPRHGFLDLFLQSRTLLSGGGGGGRRAEHNIALCAPRQTIERMCRQRQSENPCRLLPESARGMGEEQGAQEGKEEAHGGDL